MRRATRRPGRAARLVPGLLAVLAVAAAAGAQSWQEIAGLEQEGVEVRWKPVGARRLGGFGYVVFEVQNTGDRERTLHLEVTSPSWAGATVGSRCQAVVAAFEHGRWFLPVPSAPGAIYEVGLTVGAESSRQNFEAEKDGPGVLLVSNRPDRAGDAASWVGDTDLTIVPNEDLPPDWALLSSFKAVVVDRNADVDEQRQEVLRRYAFAGGSVVAVGSRALRAGPLLDLFDRHGPAPVGPVGHGMGRLTAIAEYTGATQFDECVANRTDVASPVASFWLGADIPGLGEVPVRAFLVVILLFAVAVGPVNFIVLRRRRRPLLALVTVPVLGFGTTALILAYGVFHDGFGIRGVARSASLLDQADHEVTAAAAHTLFAGLSPGTLPLPRDVVVDSPAASGRRGGGSDKHSLDIDAGARVLASGVLPSRTVTTLVTTQQGTERARLRLQGGGGDDGYRLLVDAGFHPVAGAPFVARDFDGTFYRLDGARLEPCSADAAAELVEAVLAGVAAVAPARAENADFWVGRQRIRIVSRDRDEELARALLGARRELAPGGYLGVFARPPWLFDFGLDAEVLGEAHVVRGLLAREDVLP